MLRFWRRQTPAASERLFDVLAEVRATRIDSARLITDVLVGGYRSTFRGHGVEFSDVREYVEGDDPRTVDWNVTARIGRPFVKRFVEERERTLVFALDLSASMASGFGVWSLRQAASRFCALLGLAAVANHDRVGLIAGAGSVRRFVLPQAGVNHVFDVLRDCVALPAMASAAGSDLGPLLARAAGRLRRRAVVFLCSDFLTPLPARELAVAARRHDLVAVRLLAPELLSPPRSMLRVVEPETGARQLLDFTSPAVRQAFAERVARWRLVVDDQLRRAHVDCIDIEVPRTRDLTPITQPLLRFFRRRELREVRR